MSLDSKLVKEITNAAIDIWERKQNEENKKRKSRVLRNTKNLLNSYHTLKLHVENAVCETVENQPNDIQTVLRELFDHKGYIKVMSVLTSKERSELLLKHISTMLDVYKMQCEESGSLIYRVVMLYYIEKINIKVIANELNIGERTAWRYAKEGLRHMAMLLFGVFTLD